MAGTAEATIRKMFDTFEQTGDLEAALAFFHPDVEWVDSVVAKERVHGHEGFRKAMAALDAEGYKVQSKPEEYEAIGPATVLARGYTRLVQGDAYTDLAAVWAFVVRDGLIMRGATASRRDEAMAAIGAPAP